MINSSPYVLTESLKTTISNHLPVLCCNCEQRHYDLWSATQDLFAKKYRGYMYHPHKKKLSLATSGTAAQEQLCHYLGRGDNER